MSNILLIVAALLVFSHPGLASENFKVLGRGITDPNRQVVIQLACVGVDETSNEKSCEEVQFLHRSISEDRLVGPVIRMNPSVNDKKEIEGLMKTWSAEDGVYSTQKYQPFKGLKGAWRLSKESNAPWMAVLFGALGVQQIIQVASAAAPAYILVAGGAPILLVPLVIDTIRALSHVGHLARQMDPLFEKNYETSGESLLNQDIHYWQFKAKKLKAEHFTEVERWILNNPLPSVDAPHLTKRPSTKCRIHFLYGEDGLSLYQWEKQIERKGYHVVSIRDQSLPPSSDLNGEIKKYVRPGDFVAGINYFSNGKSTITQVRVDLVTGDTYEQHQIHASLIKKKKHGRSASISKLLEELPRCKERL